MDKLQDLQQGKPASPVMAHISLTNACNLTCSFCCFANRDISEKMPTEKVFQALESFKAIGVTGVEFTGGGEPSIHPDFKEIVQYAKDWDLVSASALTEHVLVLIVLLRKIL